MLKYRRMGMNEWERSCREDGINSVSTLNNGIFAQCLSSMAIWYLKLYCTWRTNERENRTAAAQRKNIDGFGELQTLNSLAQLSVDYFSVAAALLSKRHWTSHKNVLKALARSFSLCAMNFCSANRKTLRIAHSIDLNILSFTGSSTVSVNRSHSQEQFIISALAQHCGTWCHDMKALKSKHVNRTHCHQSSGCFSYFCVKWRRKMCLWFFFSE